MELQRQRDLPQTLFSSILIIAMLLGALWIASPFLLSIVWAGLIVIATWPLFMLLQRKTGLRKGTAVLLMMLFLIVIFLLPMLFCTSMLSVLAERAISWLAHLDLHHLPTFDFLLKIPAVGDRLHAKWLAVINDPSGTYLTSLKPWIIKLLMALLGQISHIGALLVNGILMLVCCLLFYVHGETVAQGLQLFSRRLAGERGAYAITLAGKTIQAVAMGIVLTAVSQSVVAGLGLFVCHIPASSLLTAIIFLLCLMQLGPLIVMLPCVAWLFMTGQHGWAIVLQVWSLIAGTMDNVLRPLLIKRGAETSLFLIMVGVIGGLLSLGMIGLFIGPVMLAVSWRLISAWVLETGQVDVINNKELV